MKRAFMEWLYRKQSGKAIIIYSAFFALAWYLMLFVPPTNPNSITVQFPVMYKIVRGAAAVGAIMVALDVVRWLLQRHK